MAQHIITTDDDPAIRKILEIVLTKEGYIVTACKNGDELIALLKEESLPADCILLDIKMPGLSGFELLKILQDNYPSIPVIMLTAFSDLDTGMKAIRLGAADYLSKPVRKADLLECVKRVIKKARDDQARNTANHINVEYQKNLEKQLNDAYKTIIKTTLATIEAFSETIEQKDPYTKGHCNRVRNISLRIADCIHLPQDDLATLEGGALLHDIGKIGIPEQILNKPDRLTDEEYAVIKQHPETGEKIVKYIDLFKPYLPIIRNHHERYDGNGYPDGLKGEEIPILVRIVAIADAFDAMTSNRSYRAPLPKEIAVEELKLCSGTQFDPYLVNVFIDNDIFNL